MLIFQTYGDNLAVKEARGPIPSAARNEFEKTKLWLVSIVEREVPAKTPEQKKTKQAFLASLSGAADFKEAKEIHYKYGKFVVDSGPGGKATFEKLDAVLQLARPPQAGINLDPSQLTDESLEEKGGFLLKINPYWWFLKLTKKDDGKK
jgi:hypothetical protein